MLGQSDSESSRTTLSFVIKKNLKFVNFSYTLHFKRAFLFLFFILLLYLASLWFTSHDLLFFFINYLFVFTCQNEVSNQVEIIMFASLFP